jgi:hypothetical protein
MWQYPATIKGIRDWCDHRGVASFEGWQFLEPEASSRRHGEMRKAIANSFEFFRRVSKDADLVVDVVTGSEFTDFEKWFLFSLMHAGTGERQNPPGLRKAHKILRSRKSEIPEGVESDLSWFGRVHGW